ncbi:hypothetical protein PBI_DEWDROP_126 [Microbacterium phage Dewdrop]|nr:hypothetical protein PBI_LEAF_126 [Microbacterium phage Leaf]QGZ17494.1 hypothetical protein PBI_DEWDROP_126 [Microbacterium phage Dewdrop]
MNRKTTIEIHGLEYEAELARVKRTHLGREDHGILSVNIEFEGISGSWGQGTGHYFADTPEKMFPWVSRLIDFFGAWENIPGSECYVLREMYSGPIVGMVSKDEKRVLLVREVSDDVQARIDALPEAAAL